MTTLNFHAWSAELQHQRQQLFEVAGQERLLRAGQPPAKRWQLQVQPLAFLRQWRLVTLRLQWSGRRSAL
jgi:hypothetical protein